MRTQHWPCLLTIVALTLAFAPLSAGAQSAPTSQPDTVRVYLVTVGPGTDVWEKFGHNMIWIHDPRGRAGDVDAGFNWGMFDFDHFIINFLRKNMRYWMEAFRYQPMIDDYIASDRSAWVQELNLTDAQKDELLRRAEVNLLPANKFYDYDYYLDNCSTRVRDALDGVLGGEIRRTLEPQASGVSYRWHTRRLMADDWFFDLALDYVLGPWADQKINRWDEGFLPVQLMKHVRSVQTGQGPLVLSEKTLHLSSRFIERDAPANRTIAYLIVGMLIGLACGTMALPRNIWGGRALMAVAFLWSVVGAVAGVSLLVLWFFTPHVPPADNQNLLQLNPAFLVLLPLIPLLRRRSRVRRVAFWTAAIILALNVIGLTLKIMPISRQHNGDILALTLMANTGLAAGLYIFMRQPASQSKKVPQRVAK